MSDLSYPIGKFVWEGPADAADRARRIDEIAAANPALRAAATSRPAEPLRATSQPAGCTIPGTSTTSRPTATTPPTASTTP